MPFLWLFVLCDVVLLLHICMIHRLNILVNVRFFIRNILDNLRGRGWHEKAYIMFICYILTIVSPFMWFYDDSSHFDWILVMMCSSCANRLHENCVHRWTDNTRGKLCATWSRHSETRFINLTVIPDEDKLTLYRNKRILQLWFSHSVLFIFYTCTSCSIRVPAEATYKVKKICMNGI